MNTSLVVAVALFVFGALAAPPNVFQFEVKDKVAHGDSPSSPFYNALVKGRGRVEAFSWKNCGASLAAITSLSVSPDPLSFPGPLNITAKGTIQLDTLDSPLQASLLIHKRLADKWLKIPCLGEFGSCDYDDLCSILSGVSDCPDPIQNSGLGCQCPFKKGDYNVPALSLDMPYSFPSGDYNVTGTLHYNGKYVACLEVLLTVKS